MGPLEIFNHIQVIVLPAAARRKCEGKSLSHSQLPVSPLNTPALLPKSQSKIAPSCTSRRYQCPASCRRAVRKSTSGLRQASPAHGACIAWMRCPDKALWQQHQSSISLATSPGRQHLPGISFFFPKPCYRRSCHHRLLECRAADLRLERKASVTR